MTRRQARALARTPGDARRLLAAPVLGATLAGGHGLLRVLGLDTVPWSRTATLDVRFNLGLGLVLEALGRKAEAGVEFQPVLAAAPRHDAARRGLERVRRRPAGLSPAPW